MADYEIINHPADIKIKVFGKIKEDPSWLGSKTR